MFAPRRINLIAFLSCSLLLAAAFYFEFIVGLTPCPLCIAQRVAFILLGIIFLLAALHNPKRMGRSTYGFIALLTSIIGIGLAGRQVWLEYHPPPANDTCMPGLSYMLQHLPLDQTLTVMFTGTGECAQINWTFVGLSMAEWTLIMFVVFALVSIWQLTHNPRK